MIKQILLGTCGLALALIAGDSFAADYGRYQQPPRMQSSSRMMQQPRLMQPVNGTISRVAAQMPMPPAAPHGSIAEPTSFIDESLSCSDGSCGGASCSSCSDGTYEVMDTGDVFVDSFAGSCVSGCSPWSAGIEFTLVKPYFEDNVAFSNMSSNGVSFENFSDVQFNYDTELAPRVWLERMGGGDLGFRVMYWQFDHEAATAAGSPDANGFGRITHPSFGDVDLSTTIPNSVFTADSSLNAYTIDFEGTKYLSRGIWNITTSAGLRFAEVEQFYRSTLLSAQGQTQGTINYSHVVEGVGPTLAVRTQRPFSPRLSLFATGRASLLFGDGTSSLNAIEDQDLAASFTTSRTTTRNDVLPVGEVQVGFQVLPAMYGPWQPYVHVAMEGQLWSGAGNASSESGNLGFYGLNVALGFDW